MSKPKWFYIRTIVRRNKTFKPCPYCDGKIVVPIVSGDFSVDSDPTCTKCERFFKPERRWLIFRGFVVESPMDHLLRR